MLARLITPRALPRRRRRRDARRRRPIPGSSGKTVRCRLNRSADRQLDGALPTVVLSRLQPTTRAYAERRRAERRTDREIKRYAAREVYYRRLQTPPSARDAA